MGRGKALTYTNRLQIEAWLNAGLKPLKIAELLGVHNSTIYRELKRGEYERLDGGTWIMKKAYSPDIAEQKYRDGLKGKGPGLKIGNDHALAQYIEYKIGKEKYSPAAVLGEIKRKELEFTVTISEVTLYRYIDQGLFLTISNKDLPVKRNRTGNYKKVHGTKPARAPRGESIEKRPEIVAARQTFGHWEMDCVVGKQGTTAALLVFTERLTRFEIIWKLKDKTAASVVKTINKMERKYGEDFKRIFQTITVDNGSEFSDCEGMEKSINQGKRTKFFYCHPYSSWERGSNENQNKMIRRHYPKGYDFTRTTQAEINKVEKWINDYPRELFDFYSSSDLFEAYMNSVA